MKPLVSIIIPVYNAASFLSECLDSVINQTYKNLEIICVNDGSTDASLSIIKKYAKKDKRIRYYTQKNKGQSAARNIGIKMCKGEYISFIDSDDMIDLHTISVAVDLFLNEHVDMVLYNMEMFLPDGTRFICFNGELFPYESKRMNTRQKECIINFTNAAPSVIRKSSINSTFVEGMIYEDWVFMVRHLLQSLNVFWINEPFYKYRRNFEKSTTSNISYKCLDLFKAYYLSKKYIESSPMKNTYNYINDIKILNEASGFIHANLIGTDYSELTDRYISELIEIIHSFSNIYYLFLISFLNPERKSTSKYY
ncbi:MAG: glycosyltransferase family 2 protein [Clostridium neonatale]